MKISRVFYCMLFLVLVMSSLLYLTPAYAQDESPHAAIIADIPSLLNLAEQADSTFVGEVDGSYAYIAFVIRDDLVVIYVCDDVGVSEWIRAEIVDGAISATTESGVVIEATVTDSAVNGTVVLPIDDDGTEPVAHDFSTVPAVPGVTGLAREEDEGTVGGWIVTENGIRGFKKRKHAEQCRQWNEEYNRAYQRMNASTSPAEHSQWANYAIDIAILMSDNGCGSPVIN